MNTRVLAFFFKSSRSERRQNAPLPLSLPLSLVERASEFTKYLRVKPLPNDFGHFPNAKNKSTNARSARLELGRPIARFRQIFPRKSRIRCEAKKVIKTRTNISVPRKCV